MIMILHPILRCRRFSAESDRKYADMKDYKAVMEEVNKIRNNNTESLIIIKGR